MKVIISKKEWEGLCTGTQKALTIFEEFELHHQFGDEPEKEVVRVEIRKITKQRRKKDADKLSTLFGQGIQKRKVENVDEPRVPDDFLGGSLGR
jgi:hypothetical protein